MCNQFEAEKGGGGDGGGGNARRQRGNERSCSKAAPRWPLTSDLIQTKGGLIELTLRTTVAQRNQQGKQGNLTVTSRGKSARVAMAVHIRKWNERKGRRPLGLRILRISAFG